MINVIKMEFYLTIKNRIWWILALVAACFTIFFTAMINYSPDAMISSPGRSEERRVGKECRL